MSNTETSSAHTATGFEAALRVFLAGMEAVDELTIFAREHARPLDDQERVLQDFLSDHAQATPAQRSEIFESVRNLLDGVKEASRRHQDDEDVDAFRAAVNPIVAATSSAIGGLLDGPITLMHYVSAYTKSQTRVARLAVLNSSLLTSAVSNFEVLVSNVIKEFLISRPQALQADDSRYSLTEISSYESIREFQEFAADRYVDGVLRGSFDDWMKWFEKQLKIKPAEVAEDELRQLREIFQRRHLFVHNGGQVNRLYLSKLQGLADVPAIGTQLTVDSDYLVKAIDTLTAAGVLLTTFVIRKLVQASDQEHPADSMVNEIAYGFLCEQRWALSHTLTAATIDGCRSDHTQLIMRVNGWIAKKYLYGLTEIRAEVEAWQVSSLDATFKLARLALLDRTQEAYALAQTMIAQEELSQHAWATWPLLAEAREFAATTVRHVSPTEDNPRGSDDLASKNGSDEIGTALRSGGDQPRPATVREWAKSKGLEVSDKGRIARSVMDSYRAAHRES